MRKTLLLVFTFSWVYVLCIDLYPEYHYVNIPKTWAKAQQHCREMYDGDLATVSSSEENNRLITVLQETGKFAWIGLYDNTTSWKWTMGDADFNIETKDGFPPWQHQPDNTQGNGSCIAINLHGGWWDFSCEVKHPFICIDEKAASTYIVVETSMVWEDAKNYCRSKHTDLLRVWNLSENNKIHALIETHHWIGLYRNLWAKWSDGRLATFKNWEAGQPDDVSTSCAAVKTDTGTWCDVDCNEEHEFICQKPITNKRLKLRFQSEADLTDPNIQQQILEQLHAKMEANGLTDFKLRWTEMDGKVFKKEPKRKT
ncbi:macrophage mannose receptor 1-like isoform X1 [Cyprinodon tularosa]|uniref:macrophage mannose receptor 1-like isoform X1 n=1 Tax=Cyprinodon tularosa TaxID=77115 RepID=UPI0018E25552|nr:macrophage mannose receptor 1-like isoform X1 [Cyprinodon tularosa]